ncbi:NAD-dependent succinate-semialdehyde dehydrogenase [Algibacter amylolyticus]|uniref:NAD-dependent succinate-semialdehyde dehydrogenase n=1 Tax=Algibacter amylolyticus TaxID=1608400 RepID=A0A5M7BE25_9FLAO|nr:NAD-dependent succinate-semialdehyde dehydrogenase [Algibacter amylolyticus]KAA5825661.1 NAD-dependent succinate-semialdehyde dehydrogenase [Algibacter amylolyticus]MBB5268109.1 succinate-semialdehyde dehydrogenase/glutarate-semialdehyde dehydrogenase [Algibacter amylolyticus]TSJ79959.1 NAD-dependent succinate-semialdehyde dehydrogenase [Algibacter amylolyticus]
MSTITTINPATETPIKTYNRLTVSETEEHLEKAGTAFKSWKKTSFTERSNLMTKLAEVFDKRHEEYAQLATQEMGKPIEQARKEIEKCAKICRYYAEHTEALLANEPVKTEASKSYVTFQPIGVILAIMPWNFPFYQVIRFLAPALMAGNTAVLKHASNVQGCAFALENALQEAGFPKAIFSNLNVSSDHVESIIENKHIVAVTLTGSAPAGQSVAAIAGKNLKKSVLELGGSDAYIILDDADLEEATDLATYGRLQNNGQTCIAAKRFIVLDAIYNDFLELFKEKMNAAKMGDPTDEDTYYGPLARVDLRDELHKQVEKTISQGGKLILGGTIPDRTGAYYPATIISNLESGMEAFDEELFGPVASVIKAKDEKHAIELANNSKFGLGSGVITKNNIRGEKVALQLEAGNSFVNKLVVSDPRMPFGGIKTSGYGRELSGYGIREFTNTKSIWID